MDHGRRYLPGRVLQRHRATLAQRPVVRGDRRHPRLYFGGAFPAAEEVAATDVLDDNLYTTPGKFGGGGAGTTWLVGSAEGVAQSLRRYQALGITHFVLSDTPYLPEIERQGEQLLPLLRD